MNLKYAMTDNSKIVDDTTVYQIRALQDFGRVTAGDLGGYVESERDLATDLDDTAWITEDSVVYGSSESEGVRNHGFVTEGSQISESLIDNSSVKDSIINQSEVLDRSRVEKSNVSGKSTIMNESFLQYAYVQDMSLIDKCNLMGRRVYDLETSKFTDIDPTKVSRSSLANSNVLNSTVANSEADRSVVHDGSNVNRSKMIRSVVFEKSDIFNSKLQYSEVDSSIVNGSNITHGVVEDSSIKDNSDIMYSKIKDCFVDTKSRITNESQIISSTISESEINRSNIKTSDIYMSEVGHSGITGSTLMVTKANSRTFADLHLDQDQVRFKDQLPSMNLTSKPKPKPEPVIENPNPKKHEFPTWESRMKEFEVNKPTQESKSERNVDDVLEF